MRVCVQMRAFRVAVMASGGCAFRERENLTTAFYRVGWWEISAVVHHGAMKFFFRFLFLPWRNWTFWSWGILSILICIFFSDILWPVLCGSQPLQEAAHLHGEDHWFVQGQETTRSASARLRHHRFGLQVHVARYVCLQFFFWASLVVVLVGSLIFWLSLGRQENNKKQKKRKHQGCLACLPALFGVT